MTNSKPNAQQGTTSKHVKAPQGKPKRQRQRRPPRTIATNVGEVYKAAQDEKRARAAAAMRRMAGGKSQ